MAIKNHILGFPRIGPLRELKFAQESYWSRKISLDKLLEVGKKIRFQNWKNQRNQGLDFISVGDFAWYDQMLSTSMMLGNIPKKYYMHDHHLTLDILFRVARGVTSFEENIPAAEMTKWFNTNYHYIVPELSEEQEFSFSWKQILEETDEALKLGYSSIKPVLIGPLTYLWLGKIQGNKFNKLNLLKKILPVYQEVLYFLKKRDIEWVQIDEPILALDLPEDWKNSFISTYQQFKKNPKILLSTYFGDVKHHLDIIKLFSISGLHIDLISSKYNLKKIHQLIPNNWIISLGIINGRNIWKSDLKKWFKILKDFKKYRNTFWIGSSCSLLHVPIDLSIENNLTDLVKNWFSFGLQKCQELFILSNAINRNTETSELCSWVKSFSSYQSSDIVHNFAVQKRVSQISETDTRRKNPYFMRAIEQRKNLNLPILPTTTIGSFPQTKDIRKLRLDYKNNKINIEDYNKQIKLHIRNIIIQQEKLGLDVLVHGEPERNDMVEYFSDHLEGFVFTQFGWVQSYGSRCVKPPIIIGDISRVAPISIEWAEYAQSLTKKPVKGMLTGPVTILLWSFPREDISLEVIAKQIALAIRDEVRDLEHSKIQIIQIDEPALREGLPLHQKEWKKYLSWAIKSFKLCSSSIQDSTQIHTHMCYCEFQDIMSDIVKLDVDVITIETSRSNMDLLEFFKTFKYPNEIGPGVYDIHSPNIPTVKCIEKLLINALKYIPSVRLWVNPDCGLKTRTWMETSLALSNMIRATINVREKIT